MDSQTQTDGIVSAIAHAGGVRPLSRLLGISAPSVSEWRKRGRIPAERVLQVERVTGVSRHILRPDLYPREAA